jgi:phytoene dehydrogenase-like protein
MSSQRWDAVVVGAGPNGLAAAITLVTAGRSTLLIEAKETVGGGCRSAELTLPGFVHDVCSAVHPLALASPVFRRWPLAEHGLALVQPPLPLAHPLDDGTAVLLERSVEATAGNLGIDRAHWRRLMDPLTDDFPALVRDALGPLHLPHHPLTLARFGLPALRPATRLARGRFSGERARALFTGMAAHVMLPLERATTASAGLMLGASAHAVGWPLVRGGSQRLADALASYFQSQGGEIDVNRPISSWADLPPARHYLFDLTPRQLLDIAGERLPALYRRQLGRYRYGMGVFKIDYALDGPVPWTAAGCRRAGTLHLGGTMEEIANAEAQVASGSHPERPFVLLSQPSLFDESRAPAGKHTLWVYCHVPNGSTVDMTERVEAQIERFAPGFRDLVLARQVMYPADFQAYNANYLGGDINGGIQDLRQLFARPTPRLDPYRTPNPAITLCSSSTPPGGGIHGLCGYYAAGSVLRRR